MLSFRGENNILLILNTLVRKILLSSLEDKIHIFAPPFLRFDISHQSSYWPRRINQEVNQIVCEGIFEDRMIFRI